MNGEIDTPIPTLNIKYKCAQGDSDRSIENGESDVIWKGGILGHGSVGQ